MALPLPVLPRRLAVAAVVAALAAAVTAVPLRAVVADEGDAFAAGLVAVGAPAPAVVRAGEDAATRAPVRPALRAALTGTPTSSFVVSYTGFTTAQRAAFQSAVDVWSRIVVSSVPIRVRATLSRLEPGVLGSAGPGNAYRSAADDSYYAAALADALSGRDLEPGGVDVEAEFTNDPGLFYFGTDGQVPAGQYDFPTTVLHEIGHGLGFLGGLEVVDGVGTYDPGSADPAPFVYDRSVVRRTSTGDVRVLSYPRGSRALAEALQSGALLWDGASATRAASTKPRLYAPATYEPGSSVGHLDEATYRPGTANALMTPLIGAREVVRDPGPIAVAMLEDTGWRLSAAADPTPDASPSPSPAGSFAPTPAPTEGAAVPGSRFTASSPVRVLDTRDGAGRVPPGGTVDLQLAGAHGVPSDATAVVLNVTGVAATASTDVRVYPATSGSTVPAVSTLNLPTGGTRANLATVALGPTGAVRLRNTSGSVHLLADLSGWYAPSAAAGFFPLDPQRVLDTRTGMASTSPALGPGQVLDLRVAGTASVPATATAVVLNVTAVGATRSTDVRVYPTRRGDPSVPVVSALNTGPGGPVPNLVVARVGDDGSVRLRNASGSVALVADLFGWYGEGAEGALFRTVVPTRLLDTRPDRLEGGQVLDVDTDASGVVPSGATAVALNVTGVGASASTDLRAYPTPLTATSRPPGTSVLNLVRGQTAAAAAQVRTGNGQAVRVYSNSGTVAVLVDVAGWFGPG